MDDHSNFGTIEQLRVILNYTTSTRLAFLLFGVLLLLGVVNFYDYGISWDEDAQREIGTVSYNYLINNDETLLTYKDRDYGVAFELPLIGIEKLFGLDDNREVYLMRHLVTHLFFLFGLWCGYWLIFGLFKNHWLAAIGVLMVALHPQLYAHSFFNTKDIPFMSMFFVCFLLAFKAFRDYRHVHFIFLGASIGLLVNLRIMGVMLLGLVLFFTLADLVSNRKDKPFQRQVFQCFLFFLLSFWTVLYFSWPYLYENPLDKIGTVFSNMSNFRWKSSVLYFGEYIRAIELPWHYPLVWFGISTPFAYLLLGAMSLCMAVYHLLLHPFGWLKRSHDRQLVIYGVCFIFPFLAVITLDSVLYDSWRHLYFVYPAFVMIVLWGIHSIASKYLRNGAMVFLLVSFAVIIPHMVVNHPHQHVYFNMLVNRSVDNNERSKFDLDYWGVSYRRGLEEIARRDSGDEIRVHAWNPPGKHNLMILPREDRERIVLTEDDPQYFITAYRWHADDFPLDSAQEIYRIRVQNNTVMSVFRLTESDTIPPNP